MNQCRAIIDSINRLNDYIDECDSSNEILQTEIQNNKVALVKSDTVRSKHERALSLDYSLVQFKDSQIDSLNNENKKLNRRLKVSSFFAKSEFLLTMAGLAVIIYLLKK